MSLYGEYIKERLGRHIIEDERGFATFDIHPELHACYLVDAYVKPEYRRGGIVRKEFGDKIAELAKEQGCSVVFSTVAPKAKGSTYSAKCLINDGFKLDRSDSELVWFRRDL